MRHAVITAPAQPYRHKLGGGRKLWPAQCSPDSFLDPDSYAEGETQIYSSSLHSATVKNSFLAGSRLIASPVSDSRLVEALVRNSWLAFTDVVSASVDESRLIDCRVSGDGLNNPQLVGVYLAGVTVCGDAILQGPWGLELPGAHIHAGVWRDQPRHLLPRAGSEIHLALVECTDGRAHFGCYCRSIEYWLESGPRLGRRFGWSEEGIEECRLWLKSLL